MAQSGASGYGEAVADLRGSAKWLIAAGAGIATALVAGLNLRNVTLLDLPLWRQVVAGVAVCLAYALVVLLVLRAGRVLSVVRETLNDLAHRELEAGGVTSRPRLEPLADPVVQFVLDRKSDLLMGEESLSAFHARVTARHRSQQSSGPVPEPAGTAAGDPFIVDRVEDAALYYRTKVAFDALWSWLAGASAIFLVALLVFVWASTPRRQPPRVVVPLAVDLQVLDYDEAGLSRDCPSTISGVAIGGPLARPDIVTLPLPNCPSLRIPASKGVLAIPFVRR